MVSLLYIMQRCTEDLCVGFVQALGLCKLKVNHLSNLSFAGLSIFRVILLRRQPTDSCLYREMCVVRCSPSLSVSMYHVRMGF